MKINIPVMLALSLSKIKMDQHFGYHVDEALIIKKKKKNTSTRKVMKGKYIACKEEVCSHTTVVPRLSISESKKPTMRHPVVIDIPERKYT